MESNKRDVLKKTERYIKEIYDLRPWYHNFDTFGVQTDFPPKKNFGFFGKKIRQTRRSMDQQPRKESVIAPYIQKVLDSIPNKNDLSVLDLFCSDGYYGFLVQKFCLGAKLTGVDKNMNDISRCKTMSCHLNLGPTNFVYDDVYHYAEMANQFDIVLCIGGLYHLSNPKRLLELLKRITGKYLIVQSAITVEHDNPDYFETPNPWFKTWGSLFTNTKLLQLINEVGFNIEVSAINRREPPNPKHIGAAYMILRPK